MSVLEKLTEGIVNRDLEKEGQALLSKWEKTGLLEGLGDERKRTSMALLLENQAKELLREVSAMSRGAVEGFASVAFPIVRRVFGGLVANDIVSVQPMSLPSGLIFFLDFKYTNARLDIRNGDSIYGGGVLGHKLTGGVNLDQEARDANLTSKGDNADKGFYNLNNGYASPTGSVALGTGAIAPASAVAAVDQWPGGSAALNVAVLVSSLTASTTDSSNGAKAVRYDPDLLNVESTDRVMQVDVTLTDAQLLNINLENMSALDLRPQGSGSGVSFGLDASPNAGDARPVRRLTQRVSKLLVRFTVHGDNDLAARDLEVATTLHFPLKDAFDGTPAAGSNDALGAIVGANGIDGWGLENQTAIPEIDIKVDSVSVTAVTKKLKAKWTPELGQDLNAYHNLDAEVELTGILSEQIALEIDREILADLVNLATAATYYWSRAPGLFVNRTTGAELGASSAAPDFTGTVSEWYETLVETINDVSAQIHRKTLRGGANFLVVSPEVANILEFTAGFRANITADADKGSVGAVNVGSLSKKWDVFVDPYFLRNVVLVGRKGNSFLESGYVYAPYVPLQVTPTIFGIEDFVPRKGVMTRYAKKMVRPDMYGLVIVRGLLGESGATS
tara:strand:- start:3296 stop:5152 length:1857 start_codon:yes stop_codon:yes gene_type:complete